MSLILRKQSPNMCSIFLFKCLKDQFYFKVVLNLSTDLSACVITGAPHNIGRMTVLVCLPIIAGTLFFKVPLVGFWEFTVG